jgi:hypothetical protein
MSKVSKLEIVEGYNQQAIEICEELLESAKSGDIVEIVVLTKRRDQFTYGQYTACSTPYALLAYLSRMQHSVNQRIDRDME